MYRSGPPATAASALRLTRAARLSFEQTSDTALDPQLRVFLADLVAPYGLPLREDLLIDGAGHSYGEMAEPLLSQLSSVAEPVDLLVLAFASPDLRPGRATAMYLSHLCPGGPLAFSVCDQGVVAGFTGLRLLLDYARTGTFQRALLLVMEQSAIHYAIDADLVPDRHAAVGLRFELAMTADAARSPVVRQLAGVDRASVAGALAAELARLTDGQDEVTVVLGNGLAELPAPPGLRVLRAPAGQPCTGSWWQLAGLDCPGGLVVAAEYEPAWGYLSLCALEPAAVAVGA